MHDRKRTQSASNSRNLAMYVPWKSFSRRKQCCLTIISRNDFRACKMSVCQRMCMRERSSLLGVPLIDFVCLLLTVLLSRHPQQIFNSLRIRFILFPCCPNHCFGLNERREPRMIYKTLSNPDRQTPFLKALHYIPLVWPYQLLRR